jgi:hypothetical protein
MGPIQVVVEDGNNLVLEVTPTPDTTVIIDRGVAGSAATVAVGTTTSLPPGSPATVTNVGTSAAAVLNFGIPTAGGIAAGGSTTQVQYNLSGVLAGSANMTFNGTTLNVLSLTEATRPVVVQTDIGSAPNEIPLNQYLGNLAYQDAANIAGPVRIGANSSAIPLAIGPSDITPGITVEGQIISSDATGVQPLLSVRRSAATGNATIAQFTSSGTAASPTAVVSGRGLGRNDWYGFDGTNYVRSATIVVIADSTVSTGVVPGRISFQTASTSAGVPVERMRIDSSGNVVSSVPTTPPALSTNGTMVFNLTSDTNLRVSVRGSDGVTRTANITLA